MRLTKHGHACVEIEHEGVRVVIDPGGFTAPGAAERADVVLITHEHADHWTPEQLRGTTAPIHTIAAVAEQIREQAPDVADRVTIVAPGDRLDLGVPVTVVGEKHAVIHADLPHFDNSGYLLDLGGTTVLHPGDALSVPEESVDLLLLPVSAPWLKVAECVDYARAVGAPRSVGIHDKVYSEVALEMVKGHLARLLPEGQEYLALADGEHLG